MPKLLSVDDLSDVLGVPVNTLYQWRTKGYGPTGLRIGKYVRYRPDDVQAWVDRQAVA
jgi:predicted DNA-binding transcriptional regulator AlpA